MHDLHRTGRAFQRRSLQPPDSALLSKRGTLRVPAICAGVSKTSSRAPGPRNRIRKVWHPQLLLCRKGRAESCFSGLQQGSPVPRPPQTAASSPRHTNPTDGNLNDPTAKKSEQWAITWAKPPRLMHRIWVSSSLKDPPGEKPLGRSQGPSSLLGESLPCFPA